jgi:dihydroflavonol-4-reductase
MRVYVTGATGYVGINLLHELAERNIRVRALCRPGWDRDRLARLAAIPPRLLQIVEGDILEPDSLRDTMEGCHWVIHLAGNLSYWSADKELQDRVNSAGAAHVARAALAAGAHRFIHVSSCAAIGVPRRGQPADETFPFNGDRYGFNYFTSKHEGEAQVLALVADGLPAVVVNPGMLIGGRDPWKRNLLAGIIRGRFLLYPKGGNCFVDVGDVVRGILLAAERGQIGERYILGGYNLKNRELMRQFAAIAGTRVPHLPFPTALAQFLANYAETHVKDKQRGPLLTHDLAILMGKDLYYSSAKAEHELGYTTRPLADTLTHAAAWYRMLGLVPGQRHHRRSPNKKELQSVPSDTKANV